MLTSVLYAFVAFGIALAIYFAIATFGAKKEWGDAIKVGTVFHNPVIKSL